MHPAVNQEALINQDWLGYVAPSSSGIFVDNYLLLIFGGIPYQVVTFDNIQSLLLYNNISINRPISKECYLSRHRDTLNGFHTLPQFCALSCLFHPYCSAVSPKMQVCKFILKFYFSRFEYANSMF